MIATSAGSRPDAKKFLDGKVEELMTRLGEERIPSGFDQLAHGAVPNDIKTKTAFGQIVV
jgi:hypothetical protein